MLIGNAVVGQSGGPTAAINATLAGVIRGALERPDAIKTLYGMRNGIEGLLREDLIDLNAIFSGNEHKITTLEHTPAAALGSCRKKLPTVADNKEFYENLINIFKKYDIRYFFYIGGNDSMDTVAKLSEYSLSCGYELRVMGVPKTIDNDLVVTDHTPGFGSAAKFISTVMQEIIYDCAVYTVPAVTIVEIMGRDAGWLTAASAIGQLCGKAAPDYVYLPEVNFDNEKFLSDVKAALDRHPNVVIAVSEGIRYADGTYVGASAQSGAVDIFGHAYLAGTAKSLERLVKDRFGCKVRSIELNLPQRCGAHIASKTDIDESVMVGRAAVNVAAEGVSCQMMTYKRNEGDTYSVTVEHYDVSKIANQVKFVPREFINAEENGVTDECCKYIQPLTVGESYPEYVDGMPEFFKF